MVGEIINDNFLTMEDNFDEYMEYIHSINADYNDVVERFDRIIEEDTFNKDVYIELTGLIKYISKRVFPLLSAFLGQDENFDEDIYPEFMDIQLMVLYLFDKLQYQLDEIIMKWNLNDAVIEDQIINLESINYLFKLILPQLTLFGNVLNVKIQLIEGKIDDGEFEKKMIEIHDSMFV